MKLIHQVAIDQGEWTNALLMWPDDDPLGTEDFGGDEEEMKKIHSYRKALSELKTRHGRQQEDGGDAGAGASSQKTGSGKTGNDKQNKKRRGGQGQKNQDAAAEEQEGL